QGVGLFIAASLLALFVLLWRIKSALRLAAAAFDLFGGAMLTGGAGGMEMAQIGRQAALGTATLAGAALTGGATLALGTAVAGAASRAAGGRAAQRRPPRGRPGEDGRARGPAEDDCRLYLRPLGDRARRHRRGARGAHAGAQLPRRRGA